MAAGGARRSSGGGSKAKGSHVRDHLLLSSKVFNPVGPGPNDRGLSRRHILRQIEASLARLQTDRLDMYLIHEPDPETPLEETLQALDDLVRAGKVLYIGASNIEAWRLARALVDQRRAQAGPLRLGAELLQPARPDAGARDLAALRRQGVGFTAFSPLAGGWLTGKYQTRRDVSRRITDDAAAGAVPPSRTRCGVSRP